MEWFGLPEGFVASASTAESSETLARPSMCPGCLATNRRLANSERRFRAVIDALPQMVGVVNSDASVLYANKQWYAYTGNRAVTTSASHLDLAFHPADGMAAYKSLAAIEPVSDISSDVRVRRADGIYRWHQVHFVRFEDEDGILWTVTFREVEEQYAAATVLQTMSAPPVTTAVSERATAAQLRESNRLMKMAEEMAHVGHWRLDLVSNELFWSDEVFRTFGLPTTHLPTLENGLALYHPEDRERVGQIVGRAISDGTPFEYESRIVRPDGTTRYVRANGQSEYAPDGSVIAIFGVFQDVTDVRNVQREHERLNLRITVATKAAHVGIWDLDVATDTIVWDCIMFALYGFADAQFSPTYDHWATSIHPDDRTRAEAALALAASGGPAFDTEFRVVWSTGAVHNIRAMATILRGADGRIERMIGTNWDITEVRMLADQLQKEKEAAQLSAAHDVLTGLLNRRGLEAWIESEPGIQGTLLYLDADGFKAVNDRGGHAAGDETLRLLAAIIRDAVRASDCCARIGGDEFVVVLLHVSDCDIVGKIIARITSQVEALRPLGPDDDTRIGISIGIGHLMGAGSMDDALREGDADLYRSKNERKAHIIHPVPQLRALRS